MSGLIKNQLVKHLAKFFKNLSTDSFKLSTMKGHCELHNLELNEEVLMDLLELPVWLNISKATCSHAAIKIPWANLNRTPICLGLDEVSVQVEICENFRIIKNPSPINQSSFTKYGWIDRIIDGIRITISAVVIRFTSPALSATFQLSQLEVESRLPNWKSTNNLKLTHFRDKERGLVLNFKHIEWGTMKFEAKTESTALSAPLRLICQGACRLMIKKRIADCQVVGARIMLVFNDLLWVLTDAMLVSAFHFVTYIFNLIKRAPITKKVLGEMSSSKIPSKLKLMTDKDAMKKYLELNKYFNFETSYHLVINCLQLQICDDLDPVHGRSSFSSLATGGSLHAVVNKLILDVYPYEKALGSRENWLKYGDPSPTRELWMRSHLFDFADRMANFSAQEPSKTSRISAQQCLNDLFSMVILLRIGDYCVKCVSTSTSRRGGGRKFGADADDLKFITTGEFPGDMPALYVEFNQYYNYEYGSTRVSLTRPVPDPVMFVNAVPMRLLVDIPTLLWLNALQTNLEKSIHELKKIFPRAESSATMFVRIEALMPTITIDLKKQFTSVEISSLAKSFSNSNALEAMQIKCSKVVITNSMRDTAYLSRLNNSLQKMKDSNLFTNRECFPWMKEADFEPIAKEFLKIMGSQSTNYHTQVWVMDCDPVWFDFQEKDSSKSVPFLDPVQATIWIYLSPQVKGIESEVKDNPADSDLNVILCVPNSVKVYIEHDGYMLLMRLIEKLNEFNDFLTNDSRKIAKFHGNTPLGVPQTSLISLIPGLDLDVVLEKEETIRNKGSNNFLSSSDTIHQASFPDHIKEAIGSNQDPLTTYVQTNSESVVNFANQLPNSDKADSRSLQPSSSSGYRSLSSRESELIRCESSSNFTDIMSDFSPNDEDEHSIRSDLSGEDGELVIIGLENLLPEDDVYFTKKERGIEEALEATELSVDQSSDSTMKASLIKRETLSLTYLSIKIKEIALVKQAKKFHSSLLAELTGIGVQQFQKIPFSEYQSNQGNKNDIFSAPEEKTSATCISTEDASTIVLRLDSILNPSHKNDLMSTKIQDIDISIDNQMLLKLLDFLNDPDAVDVMPAVFHFKNVRCKVVDSTLKTPPIGIDFKDTIAERGSDNIFRVSPSSIDGSSHMLQMHRWVVLNSDQQNLQTLENFDGDPQELLSRIFMDNTRLSNELYILRNENELLKSKLKNQHN